MSAFPVRFKGAVGFFLIAALLAVAPACGGDDNPTTVSPTLAMSPGTLFLTVGSTGTALVTSSGVAVTPDSWVSSDSAIVTPAPNPDGTASLNAVAKGSATITATVGSKSTRLVVTVGDDDLSPQTMIDLAEFLTLRAGEGVLTNVNPHPVPVSLNIPADLFNTITADLGPPDRMIVIFIDPRVYDRQPIEILPEDLRIGDAAPRTFTSNEKDSSDRLFRAWIPDPQLHTKVTELLQTLKNLGFDTSAFDAALAATIFHEEGAAANGLMIKDTGQAVTFPGKGSFGYGGDVISFDSSAESHTVLKKADAETIRAGDAIKDGALTEAGATALHEMMHTILWQGGHGEKDDDGDLMVGSLEKTYRAKINMELTRSTAGSPRPGDVSVYSDGVKDVNERNGADCLTAIGLPAPARSVAVTAPPQVNVGQTFNVGIVSVAASGRAMTNEDVFVEYAGAAVGAGDIPVKMVIRHGSSETVPTFQIQAAAERGEIRITAKILGQDNTVTVTVVDPNNKIQVLVLAQDLELEGFTYAKGEEIELSRIEGGNVSGPEAGCESDHMHGSIFIDSIGPFTDPNPSGCGFGEVQERN